MKTNDALRRTAVAALVLLGAATAWSRAEEPAPAANTQCAMCHEAQITGFKTTPHASLTESCTSCHGDGTAHVQGSLESGKPGPIETFKNRKAEDVNDKCLSCHDKWRQANWHGGLHDRRSVSCTSCHSVHAFKSEHAQLKTTRADDTCYSCHTNIRNKSMRVSHHPVREGVMSCQSCHDPHDGTKPKMVKGESLNETCLSCHTEKRGPHLWEHAPVRENCASCHDPHGSNHEKLLVAKQPYLCQRCHLNTRHPVTLYDLRNTLVAGTGAVAGTPSNRAVEHSCKNCHQNIHGGNAPSGPYLGR